MHFYLISILPIIPLKKETSALKIEKCMSRDTKTYTECPNKNPEVVARASILISTKNKFDRTV